MNRILALALCMVLLSTVTVRAQENGTEPAQQEASEPKALSGISIIGNDDAPKSLYIVPWKSSEIGMETSLTRMLDAGAVPVDREVFQRELDFYQVSAGNNASAPAAVSQILKTR